MNTNTEYPSKETVIKLFTNWINQRPGLDWRDYGNSYNAYKNDANNISKQRKEALKALRLFGYLDYDPETFNTSCRWAYSGRLQVIYNADKGWFIDYCTGQYWPTEYRQAAAAVLNRYADFICAPKEG